MFRVRLFESVFEAGAVGATGVANDSWDHPDEAGHYLQRFCQKEWQVDDSVYAQQEGVNHARGHVGPSWCIGDDQHHGKAGCAETNVQAVLGPAVDPRSGIVDQRLFQDKEQRLTIGTSFNTYHNDERFIP